MKKRIALIIITLTLFAAVAFADGVALTKPINATLPATGAGAALITLDAGINAASYAIQARGDVDILISDTVALTKYWTIKAGTSIALDQILGKGANLFYAESGGAADTIELIVLRP